MQLEVMAARLKEQRSRAQLTLDEVSKQTGMARKLVSNLEHCRRPRVSLETVYRLAEFYEVSIDYLTGRTNEQIEVSLF